MRREETGGEQEEKPVRGNPGEPDGLEGKGTSCKEREKASVSSVPSR